MLLLLRFRTFPALRQLLLLMLQLKLVPWMVDSTVMKLEA